MRAVLLWAAAFGLCYAQQPRFTDAKLDTHAVTAGLERDFQSMVAAENGPAWIGYAVRAVQFFEEVLLR